MILESGEIFFAMTVFLEITSLHLIWFLVFYETALIISNTLFIISLIVIAIF